MIRLYQAIKWRISFAKSMLSYPYWVLERKRNHALKHHGMEALDILHESLTKEDIVYWLYGGTLLGFVREGGFIADDTDIDIGVWYQRENHGRIEKCLARHNFNKNWEIIIDDVICIQRFAGFNPQVQHPLLNYNPSR